MNQNKQKSKEQMEEEISILNKAEETSTIMTLLCEKLGLIPKETTFEAFRDAFGGLQMKALEIRKEMQSQFISSMEAKKPRKKRVVKQEIVNLTEVANEGADPIYREFEHSED